MKRLSDRINVGGDTIDGRLELSFVASLLGELWTISANQRVELNLRP